MYSLAKMTNTVTSLAQNINSTYQLFLIQLMSDGQRYLLQPFFDNERSFQTITIGSENLTLTAAPSAGDKSATLEEVWPYATGEQSVNFTGTTVTVTTTTSLALGAVSATLSSVWPYTSATVNTTFSSGQIVPVTYTNGSTAITWPFALTSACTNSLTTVQGSDQRPVQFTAGSATITWKTALDGFMTTTIGTTGFQSYTIPAVISKITNDTINVGQLKFVPLPLATRDEWDKLNFLPYNSDIPGYFFIYNGQLKIFPVPSTTGNLLTFNYKTRVPDFSTNFLFSDTSGTAFIAGQKAYDYQAGTLSGLSVGATAITGSSTSWNTTGKFPLNTDVSFYNLYLIINPPYGDGIAYPISQFNSDTSLTLATPLVNAPSTTTTGTSYSIGQYPVLQEDFQDMLVDYALMRYYTDIVKNADGVKLHKDAYDTRYKLLENYAGTKTVNVNLRNRLGAKNPNRYIYSQIGIIPLP